MTSYMYIGQEQYFAPISDPKVEVNTGDVIEVTAEQEKKIDKRLFMETSTSSIERVQEQIKSVEESIANMEAEKAQLVKDIDAKYKEEKEVAVVRHDNNISYFKQQIKDLQAVIDLVKTGAKVTKTKAESKKEVSEPVKEDTDLAQVQAKYVEVTGKQLPPAQKNNKEWLQDKIDNA